MEKHIQISYKESKLGGKRRVQLQGLEMDLNNSHPDAQVQWFNHDSDSFEHSFNHFLIKKKKKILLPREIHFQKNFLKPTYYSFPQTW